jgi:LmbE family N-acetylglucosaminyl deacetylase
MSVAAASVSGRGIAADLRRFYWRRLEALSAGGAPLALSDPAIVVAPHFDDETLGCGGTILRKTRAGAAVRIVFMTDGGQSHARLIPRADLRRIRLQEGLAAAHLLGIAPADVHLLGFADGALSARHAEAVDALSRIIAAAQPTQVFVPYADEPPLWSTDHRATTAAVAAAMRALDLRATVYEYPVWFWLHWPWVSLRSPASPEGRAIFRHTLGYRFGARALRDFRCLVPIGDLLPAKRAALAAHRSQTTRLVTAAHWPTLADVAGGAFLACFFQPYEIFRRTGSPATAA